MVYKVTRKILSQVDFVSTRKSLIKEDFLKTIPWIQEMLDVKKVRVESRKRIRGEERSYKEKDGKGTEVEPSEDGVLKRMCHWDTPPSPGRTGLGRVVTVRLKEEGLRVKVQNMFKRV